MPNQSLGIQRPLQIKLFFCLFNHFNSLQCEIWTCQQMAGVLCLPAGGVKCHSCAREWKARDAHDMFITSPVQPEPEPGHSPAPICRAGAGLPTTPKSERHYFHQNETHNLSSSLGQLQKVSLENKTPKSRSSLSRKRLKKHVCQRSQLVPAFISNLLREQWENEIMKHTLSLKASRRDWSGPVKNLSENYLIFIKKMRLWKLSSSPVTSKCNTGSSYCTGLLVPFTVQFPNNKTVYLN